jgi:hypothetical protein
MGRAPRVPFALERGFEILAVFDLSRGGIQRLEELFAQRDHALRNIPIALREGYRCFARDVAFRAGMHCVRIVADNVALWGSNLV